jgi:ABC-type glycerol-3-phosphate transport system permease component
MIRFIIEAILLYIAFKFIFELLIPLFSSAKKASTTFRSEQPNTTQTKTTTQTTTAAPKEKKDIGEYIDYEDVK